MTGTSATLRLPPPPQPADGPLPDTLVALEAEFFVEWQVSAEATPREK